jgi:hypothetical protein
MQQLDFFSAPVHLSAPMNFPPVEREEELHTARRLCEAGAWPELLDFVRE